jgi:anti-sigma B factor antagonist
VRPLEQEAVQLDVVARSSLVRPGTYVVELAGEFDHYSGPQFERTVLEAIGRGALDIVVDLSEVTFVDSTTIGILMRTRKRLTALQGRLLLVCRDKNILRLLNMTTLNRLFEVHQSREEALKALDADSSLGRG